MLDERVFRRKLRCTVAQLRAVRVEENGEPLVDIRRGRTELRVNSSVDPHLQAFTGTTLFARKEVVRRVHLANKRIGELLPGAELLVWTAYRHPYHVVSQFVGALAIARRMNPELTYRQAENVVDPFRSVPDISPHATGAAVDVTLVINGKDGKLLPPKNDEDALKHRTKFHPFSLDVREFVRKRRLALRRVMLEAGFAPTMEEWWHFSYGDREWTRFYKQRVAMYGPIQFVV